MTEATRSHPGMAYQSRRRWHTYHFQFCVRKLFDDIWQHSPDISKISYVSIRSSPSYSYGISVPWYFMFLEQTQIGVILHYHYWNLFLCSNVPQIVEFPNCAFS